MRKIVTLISFAFVLILSMNTKLLAQTTKPIDITVESYDGENVNRYTATVQILVGGNWVDFQSSTLLDGNSLRFRVICQLMLLFE